MGTNFVIDFEEFKQDVLPSLPNGATKFGRLALHQKRWLFEKSAKAFTKIIKPAEMSEIEPAETVVDLINSVNLPNGYKAATFCYDPEETDSTHLKVDAALYAEGQAPEDGAPVWSSCRLYMEFKKGSTAADPFDDRLGWNTKSHDEARSQLITYAWNVFLYQHRVAFFSLLITGDCFRAMRWDRSGVVVSRKVNYVEDP
ncbi:hypothetical protein C8Q78DRAFT_1176355, partial [Trametes maxima]